MKNHGGKTRQGSPVTDMENIMCVPSAARVFISGLGKMFPLNIRFFVVYALAVAVLSLYFVQPCE